MEIDKHQNVDKHHKTTSLLDHPHNFFQDKLSLRRLRRDDNVYHGLCPFSKYICAQFSFSIKCFESNISNI